MYRLRYSDSVKRDDLPRIDSSVRARIGRTIREKLELQPDVFGKPLRSPLAGLWVLRIGEWRAVYQIQKDVVILLAVRHRKKGYGDLST